MIQFGLGFISGLIVSIIFLLAIRKNEHTIERLMNTHPYLSPQKPQGYISGLSEEESTYLESLQEKEIHII